MSIYRGRTCREFFLTSLLYDSILDQDKSSILILLKKGADANIVLPTTGISPFHLIIGNDCASFAYEITTLILQNGGDPNVRSDEGITPVHIAAAWNRLNLLELLLLTGGDPEICDINYKTPINYALEEGFTDCYELMCSYKNDTSDYSYENNNRNVSIKLDKIIIDNGVERAEYDTSQLNTVVYKNSITNNPKTEIILYDATIQTTIKYVQKWCDQDQNYTTPISTNNNSDGCFSSLDESDVSETTSSPPTQVKFKKRYTKTRKISRDNGKQPLQNLNSTYSEASKNESGIFTLSLSSLSSSRGGKSFVEKEDCTSDYFTSSFDSHKLSQGKSAQFIEKVVLPDDTSYDDDCKIVKISRPFFEIVSKPILFNVHEVYKYVDNSEDIVLLENRFLKKYGQLRGCRTDEDLIQKTSLPKSINYDTNAPFMEIINGDSNNNNDDISLQNNLIHFKTALPKKLMPSPNILEILTSSPNKVYSSEVQKTLDNPDYFKMASHSYKTLEETLINEFNCPDRNRKWRGGLQKASFSYLLLDPRITQNLSSRSEELKPEETWRTFLNAIFYVGKGQKNRPYNHLGQAVKIWKQSDDQQTINKLRMSKKVQSILDIWADGYGVVCVHVFQNTIPVEAYTREALMISALSLENLTNIKEGNAYGIIATWTPKQKELLGSYLLYKAMNIYLNEGERQLNPEDI